MVGQAGQTFLSAYAMKEQGKAVRVAAHRRAAEKEFEAEELENHGSQVVAASQRARDEVQRQGTLLASRAQAVAAASGGGASDATVVNLITKIKGESAYRGAVALYQGEDAARKMKIAARVKRYEAAVGEDVAYREQKLGNTLAMANLAMGSGSLSSKYGGGGYKAGGDSGGSYPDAGSGDSGGGTSYSGDNMLA